MFFYHKETTFVYLYGPDRQYGISVGLEQPIIGENSFRQSLKTFLFATY